MYVGTDDFKSVCAYIDGIHATNGCLTGFREWLVVHLGTGNNLAWHALVQHLMKKESIAEDEQVSRLGQVIGEFHQFTGQTIGASTGLMRVYVRYHGWLLNQTWYRPDRIDYVPPYGGIMEDGRE